MRTREAKDTRNKNHVALTYWGMAKECRTNEGHLREHVQPTPTHEPCPVDKRFPKNLFSTKEHEMTVPNTEAIVEKAQWPTFSPLSAQFQYGSSECCSLLYAKAKRAPGDLPPDQPYEHDAPYEMASRCWRGILFRKGLIMQRQGTDEYYVSLGKMGTLLVGLWKVKPVKLLFKTIAYVVGSGDPNFDNAVPTWVSPVDLDDFDATPTKVISPAHT